MGEDSEMRETVRRIWAAALSAPVDDAANFYDLGGHSFTAAQIITRLNNQLPVHTSITTLFDNPKFADFVSALAARPPDGAQSG